MHIGIHGKPFPRENRNVVQLVFDQLKDRDVSLFISSSFMESLKKSNINTGHHELYKAGDDLGHLDILFTLGGDGTLLESVTHINALEVPILGFNTGRMGFLATTARENIAEAIETVFNKNYTLDKRTLLKLESEDHFFGTSNYALNDFTILKKDTSSMILVHAYVEGEFLNSYWADGIIVSTPTGSTGYSLSCGGPMIMPGSASFAITPVSPHNLTARPMIVPDDCKLSFKVEGRSKNFLISLDSRFETVKKHTELSIQKASFNVCLIKPEGYSYFKTIRQKLSWGVDIRN